MLCLPYVSTKDDDDDDDDADHDDDHVDADGKSFSMGHFCLI